MISDVVFGYRKGVLISYRKNGLREGIPYSAVKHFWRRLTVDSIEGWTVKAMGNTIAFIILVAQGQGGALYIWDTEKREMIHFSEGEYGEDFIVVGSKIITLEMVSNFVTPYHIELWCCEYGLTEQDGSSWKQLYCTNPVRFDEGDSWMGHLRLKLNGRKLYVVAGNREYLYSEDVTSIADQRPNPAYKSLYQEWQGSFDPRKGALQGMII